MLSFSEATEHPAPIPRPLISRVVRLVQEDRRARPTYILTRWVVLRLMGLVYLIAFASLTNQITGLVGKRGISPCSQFLDLVKANVGPARYWLFPTLKWFDSSDTFLLALTITGIFLSVLLIAGIAPVPVSAGLWVLYLSLVTTGQDFMMYQWDALLLEAGFLTIFFAPRQILPRLSRERPPSSTVLWLFRILRFRLMFSSALAKLLSGDPTWRNLTALNYYYETRPIATALVPNFRVAHRGSASPCELYRH